MEQVTRNTSKNTKTKPIVDVPKSGGVQDQIKEFVNLNKNHIAKFMKTNFEGVTKKEVIEVIRECAECSILVRSPKEGGCWGEDTEVIEDALKVCEPVDEVAKPKVKKASKPKVKAVEEESVKDEEDTPEAEEVAEDKEKAETTQEAAPKKKRTKAPAKKAATKTGTKTAKTAKKATAKKVETKKEKTAKKPQPKTEKKAETDLPTILTMPRFSEEKLKGLKGLDLWLGVARCLKIKGQIRCQVQDMPLVIGHLYEVHKGKVKLNEEGFEGKGEKSYGRQRLVTFLSRIQDYLNK